MNEPAATVESSHPLDGPCIARRDDLPSLVELTNRIFRPASRPGHMGREFPLLLGESNLGHQLILRDRGRVISHVGVLRQTMRTLGVEVPVACIGAVCTDPDYRKAGLAGQLMDLAIRRSIEAGDLLMVISGRRTLYASRGAASLGPQVRLNVPIRPGLRPDERFHIRSYGPGDWLRLAGLQARRDVRYVWTDRDRTALEAILQMGGIGLLAGRQEDEPCAGLLFCVNHPMYGGRDGCGQVVQFIGDVDAVPALLAGASTCAGVTSLAWSVLLTADAGLCRALQDLGATGPAQLTGWTLAILNLAGLVEKIAPALARAGVELSADKDRLTLAAGGRSVSLAEPHLQVELLFREAAAWSEPLVQMPADLRTACRAVLPVPLPDYGINFV